MLIKNNYKKTSNFFILNGTSEYNIILPCIAEEYEEKAAAELSCFLFRATGAQLKILYEDAVVEDGKYIFLGNLSANNEVKSSLSYKQLNKEGFVIVTKGENISIVGKSDRGTLFGVYKFLEKTVGYRYYGIEQINFNTEKDVPLYLFDWVEMPDIEARCLGHYEVFKTQYNPEYPIHTDRLRLARTAWTDWVMFAHTYFSIIPKDKYFETHRDFYSPDGGNLCLSNLELRKEFLKNLKQIITENEGDLVMIGQEDTFEFCD